MINTSLGVALDISNKELNVKSRGDGYKCNENEMLTEREKHSQ